MAYTPATLNRVVAGIGNSVQVWTYTTTDVHTDVDAANYFADGSDKGMRVNDVVLVIRTATAPGVTAHRVSAVTAGGAASVNGAILA